GPQRVRTAGAGQPQHPRRPAPAGHAGLHQLRSEGPGVVPAAGSAGARRPRRADLRRRPARPVHAVRGGRADRVPGAVPGHHARGRDRPAADGRAWRHALPVRAVGRLAPADRLPGADQHVAERSRRPADRDAGPVAGHPAQDQPARAGAPAVPGPQARPAAGARSRLAAPAAPGVAQLSRSSTLRVIRSSTGVVPAVSTRAQSVVAAVNTVPPGRNSPMVAAPLPKPQGPLGRVSPTARMVKSAGAPSEPVGRTGRPASRSARSNSTPSHSYPARYSSGPSPNTSPSRSPVPA